VTLIIYQQLLIIYIKPRRSLYIKKASFTKLLIKTKLKMNIKVLVVSVLAMAVLVSLVPQNESTFTGTVITNGMGPKSGKREVSRSIAQ
jgi:hypothetical protein